CYGEGAAFFRGWEIHPAVARGQGGVAHRYVILGFVIRAIGRLPGQGRDEGFLVAPKAQESYRLTTHPSTKLASPTTGFIEFCSSKMGQDLRPKFASYFDDLERHGRCRSRSL